MNEFEKNEHKGEQGVVASRFADFRGKDLFRENFANVSMDVLQTADFDTETVWPEKDRLPNDFSPEKLLEESKNPGLGIRELHEQGITGEGVVVAIIDQKLDTKHPEYKNSIVDYTEYDGAGDEKISMHGPAVASLLVGKDCGVAPEAKLVYKAIPSSDEGFHSKTKALIEIINKNKDVSQNEKVRVVSCSFGYAIENPKPGLDRWIDALEKAKKEGIFVIDSDGSQIDVSFVGGGSPETKDSFENYSPWLHEAEGNKELNKIIDKGDVGEIAKKLREQKKEVLSNISDADLTKKIEEYLGARKKEIVIPSDYRTMASSWSKKDQYAYNGKGGISWSVPYLAGLFALILQVNPNIGRERIAEIINESAVKNEKGLRVVNPKGIIDLAKMEQIGGESADKNESDPEELGAKFNNEDFSTFVSDLRQKIKSNPLSRFDIIADWVNVQKTRAAKALLDQYSLRLNIDSITIRATHEQHEEDVNAFESGVKWERVDENK